MTGQVQLEHGSISYIEYPAADFERTKAFFAAVFDWKFTDYGDEYTSFHAKGLMGGFFLSEGASVQEHGGALLVFYSDNLEGTLNKVIEAGGVISREIFPFPGGRRFQFLEPSGNEMAVWSDR
ncbi:VOC family protein [Vibrio sp. JC009]|uniref:VOC family protein n=1 Tax=Vibrio sp. JC009 TaxID=2912314 RepID=UPI0023AE9620|nr:VOC family protein [Vibrio sp. JC009]WED24229.1 VOC family protein [Vibrio sp. JC009]